MNIKNFEESLGYAFNDPKLLEQAFTHRSYLNENRNLSVPHNERLEFLGDAVLELVITDFLYREFPEENEGVLTAYRSALVNATLLAEVSEKLGMNNFLLLSKGEARDIGRARQYILANTYESVTGAIYLDQGYEKAKKFIHDSVVPELPRILKERLWQDAKSFFQEKAQEIHGQTPTYVLVGESGPDHDKCFTVGVRIGSEQIATGQGKSKQEAEQTAAREGLNAKGWV
ncbi:MAG: ribonuclease III [Candidatus Paceibacterota bacterium]